MCIRDSHLRIEKGEAGGYTVLAIDHFIRVKASDVFRHDFAGKENRKATEQLLGSWREPSTSLQPPPADTGRTTVRNQTLRDERCLLYTSLERGHRPVTSGLAVQATKVFNLPPTALPLEPEDSLVWSDEELKSDLGALGYPGFAYLRGKPRRNPAQLLFHALNQSDQMCIRDRDWESSTPFVLPKPTIHWSSSCR